MSRRGWIPGTPRTISSLVDYVKLINEVNQHSALQERSFYYRGHEDESWPIKPSLARPDVNQELKKTYATDDLVTLQTLLVERLRRLSEHHLPSVQVTGIPLDYLSWLTVAQHHNLPTFLLDFSLNPLVALYFACCDEYSPKTRRSTDGCVWIMDVVPKADRRGMRLGTILHLEAMQMKSALGVEAKLEREKERDTYLAIEENGRLHYPVLVVPRLTTRRLESQAGRFIYWVSEGPLEAYHAVNRKKPWRVLEKLCIIPQGAKGDVLKELLNFRIHPGTMRADLDGYADFLRWGKL